MNIRKSLPTIKINFKDLERPYRNNTPILSYCRQLLREGVNPNTRLEVYGNNIEPDVVAHIGKAAKLSVKENERLGPYFTKYESREEFFSRQKKNRARIA